MNWNTISLILALISVTFFVLAGIFVAERSWIGFMLSLLASTMVIGIGFMLKKKRRERG